MQKAVTPKSTVNKMSRLVLTRKLNESVVVHEDDQVLLAVKVSKIDRNQVRLAFDAEKKVKIDRQEVYDKAED
jgi:carbon storage regulator CsrA